jgi:hypothetical protein
LWRQKYETGRRLISLPVRVTSDWLEAFPSRLAAFLISDFAIRPEAVLGVGAPENAAARSETTRIGLYLDKHLLGAEAAALAPGNSGKTGGFSHD